MAPGGRGSFFMARMPQVAKAAQKIANTIMKYTT